MSEQGDYYFADEDAELVKRERDKHMAIMRGIPRRRAELEETEHAMVRYARMLGIGWDEIGAAIGMAGTDALGKYGEPAPGEDPF